jgi:hypothetical protein
MLGSCDANVPYFSPVATQSLRDTMPSTAVELRRFAPVGHFGRVLWGGFQTSVFEDPDCGQ